jgi:hypothetical protein
VLDLAILSHFSQILYSASTDRTVRVWNHRKGECLRIFRFKSPPIYSLCVNKGRLFIGAGESCWVIDAVTGAPGNRYNCRYGAINSIAVCDVTETLFVSSGFVGQMFEMKSGKSLRSVAGHTGNCIFTICICSVTLAISMMRLVYHSASRHHHQYPLPWWRVVRRTLVNNECLFI